MRKKTRPSRRTQHLCLYVVLRIQPGPHACQFEEENEEIGGGAEGGQGKRKRLFSKELRCMMYGFGDDQNPYTESVDILEDLVIEFITEMLFIKLESYGMYSLRTSFFC
ncbi:transcription initiation factor TFIID subunit 13 isoform X3 [Ictidomys tridecemlineatus]